MIFGAVIRNNNIWLVEESQNVLMELDSHDFSLRSYYELPDLCKNHLYVSGYSSENSIVLVEGQGNHILRFDIVQKQFVIVNLKIETPRFDMDFRDSAYVNGKLVILPFKSYSVLTYSGKNDEVMYDEKCVAVNADLNFDNSEKCNFYFGTLYNEDIYSVAVSTGTICKISDIPTIDSVVKIEKIENEFFRKVIFDGNFFYALSYDRLVKIDTNGYSRTLLTGERLSDMIEYDGYLFVFQQNNDGFWTIDKESEQTDITLESTQSMSGINSVKKISDDVYLLLPQVNEQKMAKFYANKRVIEWADLPCFLLNEQNGILIEQEKSKLNQFIKML